MAAETLIVTGTNGTSDYTFSKVSQNAFASRFSYGGNTAADMRFIDVDHKVGAIGSLASDVHTVTFRREVLDAETARISVAKVSIQVTVPKGDALTVTDVGELISYAASLMNKNFMEPLVIGQTASGDYNVTGPFNPVRA